MDNEHKNQGPPNPEEEQDYEAIKDTEARTSHQALESQYIEAVNRHVFSLYIDAGVAEYKGQVPINEYDSSEWSSDPGEPIVVPREVHDDYGNVVAYDMYTYNPEKADELGEKQVAIEATREELYRQMGQAIEGEKETILEAEATKGNANYLGEMTTDDYFAYVQKNKDAKLSSTFMYDDKGKLISGRYKIYRLGRRSKTSTPK